MNDRQLKVGPQSHKIAGKFTPLHVGTMLATEVCRANKINGKALAEDIGVAYDEVWPVLHCIAPMTWELGKALESRGYGLAQAWILLQERFDAAVKEAEPFHDIISAGDDVGDLELDGTIAEHEMLEEVRAETILNDEPLLGTQNIELIDTRTLPITAQGRAVIAEQQETTEREPPLLTEVVESQDEPQIDGLAAELALDEEAHVTQVDHDLSSPRVAPSSLEYDENFFNITGPTDKQTVENIVTETGVAAPVVPGATAEEFLNSLTPDLPPFKREVRYVVFKIADITNYLALSEKQYLMDLQKKIIGRRLTAGKDNPDYVCVSSKWMCYEPAWQLVEQEFLIGDNPNG